MDLVVYWLYRAACWLIATLPLEFNFRLGRLLGTLAYAVAPPYRKLVVANLKIAFEGEKSDRELRILALLHFQTLFANLLSSVKLASMTHAQIEPHVRCENLDRMRTVLKKGKGLIGVISHIGNWELFAQMPNFLPGHSFSTVYQRLGNRYLDADVRRARGRDGMAPYERKEGFGAPIKFLRDGGGLGILVDQHAGDAGVWTPMFGRLASTSPLAGTLAVRTGATLVPVAIYTEGVARWRLVVSEPILAETAEADQITAEINQALEHQIRESPQDWFWVHNRWKTPKPKFLLSTYKRGVCYPQGFDPAKLKPFRILVRSSNWLGDAVISTPAIRAIKKGRPDAHITVLTRDKLVDFWKAVPGVDDVIAIKPEESVFAVARKISSKFDVAILFPNSVRVALEAFLAGIPRRVGYRGKWRRAFLNQVVPEDKKPHPPTHQVTHYLDLAKHVGASKEDLQDARRETVRERKAAYSSAQPAIGSRPFRLGLCAGADYGPAKRWLPERFAEAAKIVAGKVSCEWLLFGTEPDQKLGEEIELGLEGKCTNLIGKTTLAELIEKLSGCDLLLTNDTGTMHLAAFLGVPTVSIFGSTEPILTGPLGNRHRVLRHHVACSPCFLRECPLDFRCMNAVTVDEVVEAVVGVLRGVES